MDAELTTAKLREMLECAKKATPGPWRHHDIYGPNYGEVFGPAGNDADTVLRFRSRDDAQYVAACDPQTTIAIIEEVLRARGEKV